MGRDLESGHDGGSPTAAALAVRVDEYDAALAVLLAEVGRRPGPLERIGRTLLAALEALHARKREEAEQVEPWYWFSSC